MPTECVALIKDKQTNALARHAVLFSRGLVPFGVVWLKKVKEMIFILGSHHPKTAPNQAEDKLLFKLTQYGINVCLLVFPWIYGSIFPADTLPPPPNALY